MKTYLVMIVLVTLLFSACSTGPSEILEEPLYDFSLGFDGKPERSKAFGNQLELVATYTANEKGNILEDSSITIEGNECTIDSINPQSFQLGQDVKVMVSCSKPFEEPQIQGTIILDYLQGSNQRFAQGEFLLTIED